MAHTPCTLIREEASTAVLFIHGILGTPDHFSFLLPEAQKKFTVKTILLPGHGGSVRDFSRTSMEAWRDAAVDAAAELLRDHRRILIAAHSMGCLLALRVAHALGGCAAGLFLLAPPMKIRVRPGLFSTMYHVFFRHTHTPRARAALEAYSIREDRHLWRYLGWIPRYLELFREIRSVRPFLRLVTCPKCLLFSAGDEMVASGPSAELLLDPPGARVLTLEHSTHFYYAPEDRQRILRAFRRFLRPFEEK